MGTRNAKIPSDLCRWWRSRPVAMFVFITDYRLHGDCSAGFELKLMLIIECCEHWRRACRLMYATGNAFSFTVIASFIIRMLTDVSPSKTFEVSLCVN